VIDVRQKCHAEARRRWDTEALEYRGAGDTELRDAKLRNAEAES